MLWTHEEQNKSDHCDDAYRCKWKYRWLKPTFRFVFFYHIIDVNKENVFVRSRDRLEMYGVISPPKFKLLFATLLFCIIARFHMPISNFYYSTLSIHYSMCIFQMQRGYGVKCDMLPMQSNILVFCILNQYPYFAFKFLRSTCNIRVFPCNFDTRYMDVADVAVQSAICLLHDPIFFFGHWTSRSSDLTLSW